jgi:hypothetical protein
MQIYKANLMYHPIGKKPSSGLVCKYVGQAFNKVLFLPPFSEKTNKGPPVKIMPLKYILKHQNQPILAKKIKILYISKIINKLLYINQS